MDKKAKIKIFQEKFYGRQDMYGKQWIYTKADGATSKGFAPKCARFWSEQCHIRNKTGVTCARCEVKQYDPVNDDGTWKHIIGEEPALIYLVQENGTIKFAAFDFDCKPGKESQGYTFEDVKVVSKTLAEESIPHGIARSTTAGFHLYIFFKDFYSAYKFRVIAAWLVERVGFMEQMRQGIRPLCEIFPRQSYTGGFGPGNGIKPPMIESRWGSEKNGFVTTENIFVDVNCQWDYLNSIPCVATATMDAVLEKYNLEYDEALATPGADMLSRPLRDQTFNSSRGKWQQPLTGSFEKVIEGCTAMRRVFDKALKGTEPSHHEGFAAFHLAMQCADGIDIYKTRMTGWGKTDRDWAQLQHSIDKSYAPWTCKKMQENGVCVAGTKCFERKPPLIMVEGQYVQQTDVAPEEWPEPGPIRYAYGKGDDFLEKLKREVEELITEQDENIKGNKLREIAKRAQVFDEDQQRALREYIKNKKVIKANDLSKMFNKATGEYSKETKEKAANRTDIVSIGKNIYQITTNPKAYAILKVTKDGNDFERISNCILEVEEERNYLDDDTIIKSVYKGRIVSDKINTPFEINQDDWWDNNKFLTYFGKTGSSNFNVLKDDVGYIRQAALAFSEKKGIQKHNHLVTQGWYQSTYLMPTVLVDADGIRPNTEKVIDLTGKHHASYLDFKILAEDEFRSTCFHLVTDFLNAWPRKWTFICLAHTLLPAIVNPMGLRKKPSLFLEGLTGSGKTELLHTCQWFWGDFDSIVNLSSTGKGLQAVAHDFKDCLLVLDDYKGLDYAQLQSLQRIIQYSYDPNAAVKLNRDSSLMKPKLTRGIIAFTGEHFLENDSAMVARTLLLEVEKQDTRKTKEMYSQCIQNRNLYSGVTPRFIHWFLHQDINAVKEDFKDIHKSMHENVSSLQNADRISYNCGLNHLLWKLFVAFMHEHGFIQNPQDLIQEHLYYITEIKDQMMARCGEEQNGEVYLRVMIQLISSGDVIIQGFNDVDDMSNKPVVGFISKDECGLRLVNILPDMMTRVIKNYTRDSVIRGTVREFGRQFTQMGYLFIPPEEEKKRFKKQVRWNGAKVYVWPFDMNKLELYTGEMDIIKGGAYSAISNNVKPKIIEHEEPEYHADGAF